MPACLRLALVLGLAAPLRADFQYPDFNSAPNLTLVGAASLGGGDLIVCPAAMALAGGAWHDVRQDVVAPFVTELRFTLSGGADGLAFVVQRDAPAALGGSGQELGYGGIANSLAVELDTHRNLNALDPSDNHLAVHTGGVGPNAGSELASVGLTSLVADLDDGQPHTLRIEYAPGALRVYLDELDRPALQVAVDLGALLDLDDGTAWVGLTAATGNLVQDHRVHDWSFDEQVAAPTGNRPPAGSTIVEPEADGQIVNPFDVHMETSALDDLDGDGHLTSDFEIWVFAPAERIWEGHGLTGLEKVHAHLGDGVFVGSYAGTGELKEQEAYVVRMRHQDDSGDPWTDFGPWTERPFLTGSSGDFHALELDDLRAAPPPVWVTAAGGTPVVLPAGPTPPGVYLESASWDLLLALEGDDGVTNRVTNPPALAEHVEVRVRAAAGSETLALPESDLTVVDHECRVHRLLLPALYLAPGQSAFLWVTLDGATWWGDGGQAEPDFSDLARGSQLPWVTTRPELRVDVVAEGLTLPVNVAFVPEPGPDPGDPLCYVTELYGTIKVVRNDGTLGDYATGLLNFNPTGAFPGSGEQGLAGITVDPLTGDVIATLLYDAGGPHYPKVVRFVSVDGGQTAASSSIVLDMPGESQGQSHQISNVEFHPDGSLIVHMGDGFEAVKAKDLGSFKGKILRMNPDGSPHFGNPFFDLFDGVDARDYVYAYGLRNPFGGTYRFSDGFHYKVGNGPSVDRLARVPLGNDFGWNGSNTSMYNDAIYNWVPAHGPVNVAFLQPEVFEGSGFPEPYMDRCYVSESGPTYAEGPQTLGKRLVEFVIDGAGQLVAGPETVVEYVGPGRATAVGLTAGPGGLYFTELYADQGDDPTATGARLLRLSWFDSDGCGIGDDYCEPAVPNSTGQAALLSAFGSDELADGDLTLDAVQLPPNMAGYFLASLTQGFVQGPGGSQGNLCLGGQIGRFAKQVASSGPDGHIVLQVDPFDMPPPLPDVQPGDSWSFQCWYRDVNPGPTSNFTQGRTVTFR